MQKHLKHASVFDNRILSSIVNMEDYFNPGFKTKPAVHVGSQSMRLYRGDEVEQAIEGMHIAAATEGDVVVVRNIDPDYIEYWKDLMGDVNFVNIVTSDTKTYLSDLLLKDNSIIKQIEKVMHPRSSLMVYFPTELEERLANILGIKLHGNVTVSSVYGTKTGIRTLASKYCIPMPEGFVCEDRISLKRAIDFLFEKYDSVIVKHTLSSAGRWMRKINKNTKIDIDDLLNELSGGMYKESEDKFVVEAWVKSKSSLCAHIEIVEGGVPVVAASWSQVIDSDGVTYVGAAPLNLSKKAMKLLTETANRLAFALKESGAVGSYGPDFLVTDDDEILLLELNARVPVTAFSLEIIKNIKGTIGTGFMTRNIKLSKNITFSELKKTLSKNKLLIQKRGQKNGIVPYNPNLLRWKSFYFVAMAESWQETDELARKVQQLFL